MQDMLDGFIRKFVLCPECDNPETDLVNILRRLKCGSREEASVMLTSLEGVAAFISIKLCFCFFQHVNPKKQTIGNSCKACGYRGMLDTRHKLCTFILKNPPGEAFLPLLGELVDQPPSGAERNGFLCLCGFVINCCVCPKQRALIVDPHP